MELLRTLPSDPRSDGVPVPGWSPKAHRSGTDRAALPEVTLGQIENLREFFGITRVATLTGLDCIGIPVVAVHRPNSRSLCVAQGKGIDLTTAKVSGLMESIETWHAENAKLPLFLGSWREMRSVYPCVDPRSLPMTTATRFEEDLDILWATGVDLLRKNNPILVPYELVHLNFSLPLPSGSGAFFMSSNGLASGNSIVEAQSHAICELVERDANTLHEISSPAQRAQRRVDLASIDDPHCKRLLSCFENAKVDVFVWETTTDVGIASFLATIADREEAAFWPVAPVAGSGCHPRRAIALARALTEAAQGRLTNISAARDDLSDPERYSAPRIRQILEDFRKSVINTVMTRSFSEAPDVNHEYLEEDVAWELSQLARAGVDHVICVDLRRKEVGIPVVRVVIPGLESMSEVECYRLGARGRRHRYMGETS